MRTLLIGVAAAGFLAAVTSASAAEQSSTKDQGSSATQAPADQSSATKAPASQTGTTASASKDVANKELSGVVKKVDKDKWSLKVLSSAGVEQDVKIAPSATITRDGTKAGLEQLKEGDEVRASFDPMSNQATKLDVQSKHTMDMDKGKSEMKSETKTESKAK
jgi:Cu/Ag efflux protein CusF